MEGNARGNGEVVTLARELVRAARAASGNPLPDEVVLAARLHLVDAIGVGLASAGSPIGAAYRAYAADVAKGGPATVFGQATGASAADAALVNGGLIHSLEFDDTHTASIAHGSAVLAAAALAVAETQNASGAALLGAYARGWEVLIRFGLAAPNGFHAKGFMSTSVTGTLASALLAAELMGLDEDRSVAAIGIALSQASGVMEFLTNGSSVKSLHPGWAAHGGGGKKPGSAAEGHLAEDNGPADPVAMTGDRLREMNHGHEEKHHDAEEQAGPAHLNRGGDAQRGGQQGAANEMCARLLL